MQARQNHVQLATAASSLLLPEALAGQFAHEVSATQLETPEPPSLVNPVTKPKEYAKTVLFQDAETPSGAPPAPAAPVQLEAQEKKQEQQAPETLNVEAEELLQPRPPSNGSKPSTPSRRPGRVMSGGDVIGSRAASVVEGDGAASAGTADDENTLPATTGAGAGLPAAEAAASEGGFKGCFEETSAHEKTCPSRPDTGTRFEDVSAHEDVSARTS